MNYRVSAGNVCRRVGRERATKTPKRREQQTLLIITLYDANGMYPQSPEKTNNRLNHQCYNYMK